MKITELEAYKRLKKTFEEKGYTKGKKDNTPIYVWDNLYCIPMNLTVGHFIYANEHHKIMFEDIPEQYRKKEFFLHRLSGVKKELVEYVKTHPEKFDRQFYKDHIETDYYSLEFKMNDFEYMPLEFIDEEMVACAMFRSVNMRYIDRRGDCEDWFYSVHRRKPEVLTQDLYILGARCFAAKRDGRIKFLEITPKEYQTEEFYYALCLGNGTQVMEDIPESVLTTNFLVSLLNDDVANIQCFSESALEKEVKMTGRGTVKFWQAAVIIDGRQIRNLHLNDERIKFFLSMYDKDSSEYEYSFKEHYKSYIRGKNSSTKNRTNELTVMLTVADVLSLSTHLFDF